MGKQRPSWRTLRSAQRDGLAERSRAPGAGGARADRLARETAIGLPSDASASRVARFFAFHDREEIGPRMLARIAKRTGLTTDDL
jgi:hypothetical protein